MQEETRPSAASLQLALARSYIIYFIFIALGLFADTIYSLNIAIAYGQWISLACFIIGPLVIAWAQMTSAKQNAAPYFERGPYRILRNPTQIGILILIGGYAVISGSMIFLIASIVGYGISDIFFRRYESILRAQYGEQYSDYKHNVPKIL